MPKRKPKKRPVVDPDPDLDSIENKVTVRYRSGEKVTVSGQYEVVGPRGGKTGREVTAVKGKRLPPVPKPGQQYKLVDRTKHKKR